MLRVRAAVGAAHAGGRPMNSGTTNLIVGFLNDFLIVAGGIISGAMLATKEVSMPTAPVLVLALIMGVVQAARRAQSKVDPPVGEPRPLATQVKVTEDTIAHVVEQVTKNLTPVTPKRVEEDIPAKPIKDSS
jgi:hypothetical protein